MAVQTLIQKWGQRRTTMIVTTQITLRRGRLARIKNHQYTRASWNFVTWTPQRCRWDPESPPEIQPWPESSIRIREFHLLRVFTASRIPLTVQKLCSTYFQMSLSYKGLLGGEVEQELMAP